MHTTKFRTARKELNPPQRPRPAVSIVGSGSAGMKDATVRMKRITKGHSVLKSLGEEGDKTHLAMLQKLSATDHTHQASLATVPLLLEKEAIAEVAGGASPRQVEVKYQLAAGYVRHALQRRFGSAEAAMQALQGLTLEVALACNVHALTQIENMSGPQAVMSGAIATDKALALGKAIQERPKTIDFGALAEMGKTLKVLREIAPKRQTGRVRA